MSAKLQVDESRYNHLLLSNNEPSDFEIVEIHKIIAHRKSNLSKLEGRIAEVQDMLHKLIESRSREEQRLSLFRAIVSPIRRIPQDVLVEIFLLTRDWWEGISVLNEFKSRPVGPLPTPSPLVITHVCSEWRRVALSTPMLWAKIKVGYEAYVSPMPNCSPDNNERLRTWLARTGMHHPLDITYASPPHHNITGAPLSWTSPYVHRIKIFYLRGETLSLTNYTFRLGTNGIDETLFPSLRRVLLREFDELVPPHFIPWHQLTHLSLDATSISLAALRSLLSKSTELLKLHTILRVIQGQESNAPEVSEPIALPQLVTLTVSGLVAWFLENLMVPAVTTLDIPFFPGSVILYRSFQSRSSFCLKSLILGEQSERLEHGTFLDLIHGMPSLTQIDTTTAIHVTPMLIASLASLDLAPNLEYLRMWSYTKIMVDDDEFLCMVSSRDISGKLAVAEPNPPPYTRIFRSH
ncbi:hypothetical protein Hypma_004100 [Hypsizygus marmoreus]|uniref:Uncharacterized protein n=1 Tax=Hypsizygus marmoreus TaxID=39966 RepID=A0A369JYN4_HYPMA|nr:hypothetical protein Hypma_004100 [Hypsizygus marmoreus]